MTLNLKFDDTIYDSIANRFGDNLPRGGVVFNSPHAHYNGTDYLDTYGRGCVHDSKFNIFKKRLQRCGHWNRPQPFPADVKQLERAVIKASKNNTTLHLGLKSDCFQWMDRRYKVTQYLLSLLAKYQVSYVIHTRSDLVAHDDYMSLIDKSLCSVEIYIPIINEEQLRYAEPGAPSLKRRMSAYTKLRENNIKVLINTTKTWCEER